MTQDPGNQAMQDEIEQQFDDGSNANWSDDALAEAPSAQQVEFADFEDAPPDVEGNVAAAANNDANLEKALEQQVEQQDLHGQENNEQTKGEAKLLQQQGGPPQDPPKGDGALEEPTFSEETLRMAGMTAEEAKNIFKDDEALKSALAWQDQQAMLIANQVPGQQRSNAPAQQQQFMQQQQQQQQNVSQQISPEVQPGAKPFEVDLNPEEWGADTVEFLNRMNSHYQEQMQAHAARTQQLENALLGIHGAVTQQAAYQQQQALERQYNDFDNKVNALPDQYVETFGKGTRHTLIGTPQFEARVKLNNAMHALASGRQQQGMPPLSESQLFDRALSLEFSNQREKAVREEVVEQVTKRSRQQTARPTARVSAAKSAEQKAQANVEKFLRENGIVGGNLHEEIDEL